MKQAALWTQCRQILGAVALATLAACGGGGGGDESATSNVVSLSGVASKGLLRNAQVTIYRVNDDGTLTSLATTTTNSKGDYTFANLPVNANVLVEVKAIAGTTMVDEATNTVITPVTGFTLRAGTQLAGSVAGSDNQLQVTPFSEMAVRRAEAVKGDGSADTLASLILAANTELTASLGFNPLTEKPVFAADGDQADAKPANRAALMLSAVSFLATGSVDCDDDSTAGRIDCVVDALADDGTISGSLKTLLDNAVDEAAEEEGYTADDIPTITPVPKGQELIGSTTRSAIDAARALFATLRNEGAALSGLGDDITAVQASFQSTTAPLNSAQVSLVELFLQAVPTFDALRAVGGTDPLQFPADQLFYPSLSSTYESGCKFFTDTNYTTASTTYANLGALVCRVTHAYRSTDNGYMLTQHRVFIVPNGSNYRAWVQVIEQPVDFAFERTGPEVVVVGIANTPIELTTTRNGQGDLTNIGINGSVGSVLGNDGSVLAGSNALSLQGAASLNTTTGMTTYALTGGFETRVNNVVTAKVVLLPGSQMAIKFIDPANTSAGVAPQDVGATTATLVIEASAGTDSVTGTLTPSNFVQDVDGNADIGNLSFQGVIKRAGTTLFSGTLTASRPDTLTLSGQAFPANSAAVTLNLTYIEPTDGQGAYTLSGSYARGATMVSVSGQGNRLTDFQRATITSGSVAMTLNSNSPYSDVTVNGTVRVGEFDRSTGLITYADGTYESL